MNPNGTKRSQPVRVAVILPTYNEAGNILELVHQVRMHLDRAGHQSQVVVVDDASPDQTAHLVRCRYESDPDVRVIERTHERGLATAIRAGIEGSDAPVVVVMDTDFNHDPAVIPTLVARLRDADIAVGSRFIPGGGMDTRLRQVLSYAFNRWLRAVTGSRVTDNLSGFFAMPRARLEVLPLDSIFHGYGDFFIRLLHAAQRRGYRVAEVPVHYRRRQYGVSKTRFLQVFVSYTKVVVRLRLRGLTEGAPHLPARSTLSTHRVAQ